MGTSHLFFWGGKTGKSSFAFLFGNSGFLEDCNNWHKRLLELFYKKYTEIEVYLKFSV